MRTSERTANFLLVVGSVIGCLLALELGLRLFWHNPYAHILPVRVIEIRLNAANLDQELNRAWLAPQSPTVRLRTDSHGYILPLDRYAKPLATVAFLGGSTTESSYVAEDVRFPALVSTLLGQRGYPVNTINAGRSGNTSHDALNILLNQMAADPPDFVVLMEATNDTGVLESDPTYSTRLAVPISVRTEFRWAAQSASTESWLLAFLRDRLTALDNAATMKMGQAQAPNIDQALLPPEVEGRYRARLKIFISIARAVGSEPVLMTQPLAPYRNALSPDWANNRQQDRFNEIIRETAQENSVLLIDLQRELTEVSEFKATAVKFLYDGMHATDMASQLYAAWIADALTPKLEARKTAAQ